MIVFAGTSELTIDDKGRLALPSKFRAVLPPGPVGSNGVAFYCVPLGPRLLLIPEPEFQAIAALPEARVRIGLEQQEVSKARLFALSERVEPDGTGRLLLPREMVHRLELTNEVFVMGAGTHLEVRGKQDGKKELAALMEEDEQ